jgi:hypothetical protein
VWRLREAIIHEGEPDVIRTVRGWVCIKHRVMLDSAVARASPQDRSAAPGSRQSTPQKNPVKFKDSARPVFLVSPDPYLARSRSGARAPRSRGPSAEVRN